MVHYRPGGRYAVHNPPPTCPKCGSHRTEVVGRSDDGRTLTVRCNSCGERSKRVVESNTSGEDMTPEKTRLVDEKLTSMEQSLVHTFASAFQRLADEWQAAFEVTEAPAIV